MSVNQTETHIEFARKYFKMNNPRIVTRQPVVGTYITVEDNGEVFGGDIQYVEITKCTFRDKKTGKIMEVQGRNWTNKVKVWSAS